MKYKICVFLLFYISALYGQEDINNQSAFHLGINVTSVLSSFSGNGNFLEPSQIPILLRFGRKSTKIRLGLGASGSSSDFNDPITGALRQTVEQDYYGTLGIQFDIYSHQRWGIYTGIEAIGNYGLEKISILSFDVVTSKVTTTKYGASTFVGLTFNINKKIYLNTESNLKGLITTKKTIDPNTPAPSVSSTEWNFNLSPPLFLYLNYRF